MGNTTILDRETAQKLSYEDLSSGGTVQRSRLITGDSDTVSVQYPLPTDGDSIYVKDLDLDNCNNYGFSGGVTDYFNSLKSINIDSTSTNPKQIKLWFKRTLYNSGIGFGCDSLASNFSNIKVELLGSGEVVRYTVDQSTDNTKYNSKLIQFPPSAYNGVLISFHTSDEVCLSNLTMQKSSKVDAQLEAVKDDGTVTHITATDSNNLRVTDAESGLAIAKGDVANTTFIHKFGNAPDFDTVDGFVNIWDGANDATVNAMLYTYSTTDDITQVSSSDATDTQDIEVQGLDVNYSEVTQTVTLTGQTPVNLATPLLRVFRMKNIGSSNISGIVYCSTSSATITAGVPTPTTTIRAVINNGNNQTLMAIYTIPTGKTGYMRDLFAATSGAKRSSSHIINVFARPFNQVFQVKYVASLNDSGTSYIRHEYVEPERFAEKTDIHILVNTDQDQAGVSGGFDIVLVDN